MQAVSELSVGVLWMGGWARRCRDWASRAGCAAVPASRGPVRAFWFVQMH